MIKSKYKSCVYIQQAVYLAPTEIRTCCQRFFVDGRIKGDVVIMSHNESGDITFDNILKQKEKLIHEINNGLDDRCDGCSLLIEKEWKKVNDEKINVISFENHSVCNMKCIYCSDTYYGGEKESYSLSDLLNSMRGKVSGDLHIAWGGGEPTARKDFENTFVMVNDMFSPRTQMIFTNALKYSKSIKSALNAGTAYVTTSTDAGSEETFRAVRQSKGMSKVFNNLRRYSVGSAEQVTIKYIFTELNYSQDELDGFISNVISHDLIDCNFLISANFKEEIIEDDRIAAMAYLYFSLLEKDIYNVSFDDHVFTRVRDIGSKLGVLLSHYDVSGKVSQIFNAKNYIANHSKSIVLWGSGEFAKYLVSTSKLIQTGSVHIEKVVDGLKDNLGRSFSGLIVQSPDAITDKNFVIIASVNYHGHIMRQLFKKGFDTSRIIPNFML